MKCGDATELLGGEPHELVDLEMRRMLLHAACGGHDETRPEYAAARLRRRPAPRVPSRPQRPIPGELGTEQHLAERYCERRQRSGGWRLDDRRALQAEHVVKLRGSDRAGEARSRISMRTMPSARARCSMREIVAVETPRRLAMSTWLRLLHSAAWRPRACSVARRRASGRWRRAACNSFQQYVTH